MDKKETVKYREEAMELAAFIKESPTPFHVTANIGVILGKKKVLCRFRRAENGR